MLQRFKSIIKSHGPLLRLALAVRSTLRPTERDRLRRRLLHITRSVERPVFVKVGANDGITGDPCGNVFLKHANWLGLLIEPVPYCARRLRSVYHDRGRFTIDQVAVGSAPGTATFYYVSEDAKKSLPGLPSWYDQLGSFDREHIVNHLGAKLEPFIVAEDVEVQPLDMILKRHGLTRIELLHIDTEGYDLEVLRSVDLGRHMPATIVVEHKHLSAEDRAELKALLVGHGYEIRDDGRDYYAVHGDGAARRQPS